MKNLLEQAKKELARLNTNAKKQFGQNFLISENVLTGIVEKSNIEEDTLVIEIGPGLGFLTEEIAKKASKVLCYEIDSDMIKVLTDKFEGNENVIIKYQDILKADLRKDIGMMGCKHVKVVANLPYYITSPILLSLFDHMDILESITIMVQKEVAERICAKPKSKDYGSLTVLSMYYANPKIIIDVPRGCFYPSPDVDSAVLYLERKEEKPNVSSLESFKKTVKAIFALKRKTLNNNLKMILPKEKINQIYQEMNFSPTVRAEELDLETIVELANKIDQI